MNLFWNYTWGTWFVMDDTGESEGWSFTQECWYPADKWAAQEGVKRFVLVID